MDTTTTEGGALQLMQSAAVGKFTRRRLGSNLRTNPHQPYWKRQAQAETRQAAVV